MTRQTVLKTRIEVLKLLLNEAYKEYSEELTIECREVTEETLSKEEEDALKGIKLYTNTRRKNVNYEAVIQRISLKLSLDRKKTIKAIKDDFSLYIKELRAWA